jgi:hypothetical protein
MDSQVNPFLLQDEVSIDSGTHLCICAGCETERTRDRSERHLLYQLRSALGAYLASRQSYSDLAELTYYYRLTTAWDHGSEYP